MVFNINLPATKTMITLLDVKILLCPQNDVYQWQKAQIFLNQDKQKFPMITLSLN